MRRLSLLCALCPATAWLLTALGPLAAGELEDSQRQKLADESRARAEAIRVSVAAGGRSTAATVRPNPVMKYTDVPREIGMATLWIWQDDGRPVALGKVEAYQRKDGPRWLYCFASASTGLVEARWPDGRRFQARKAGVEWAPIDGPAPQDKAPARLRQMKELFRRFSATAHDDVLKTSDELRPLARPLHDYAAPKQGVSQGVLCGFAANGTNPDVIVALEAVGATDEKAAPKGWRYGVVCMTASGISVNLDKKEVFTRRYVRSPGDSDEWTYFWEGMPAK